MKKIYNKLFFGRWPKPKKSEFGKAKEEILICPECNAFYYRKSWHHNARNYRNLSEDKKVTIELCPADKMKKNNTFEGEVILKNVPHAIKGEVINLIENIGVRAHKRDVLDRILYLHTTDGRIEIRTSENQLAQGIGKQVHRAHKASKIKITFSDEEKIIRVNVWWS